MALIAIGFLWRGFRRGDRPDFVLAGWLTEPICLYCCAFLSVAYGGSHRRRRSGEPSSIDALARPAMGRSRFRPYCSASVDYVCRLSLYICRSRLESRRSCGGRRFRVAGYCSRCCCKTEKSAHCIVLFLARRSPVRALQPRSSSARDVQVFGFLMVALMLPELLTYEKYAAIDFSRLLPGIPFIFMMAGLGTASAWAWIDRRPRFPRGMGYFVLALVLRLFRQWDFASRRIAWLIAERIRNMARLQNSSAIILTDPFSCPPASIVIHGSLFPHRNGGVEETLRQGDAYHSHPAGSEWSIDKGFPEAWVLLKDGTVFFLPPMPENIEPLNSAANGVPAAKALALARRLLRHTFGGARICQRPETGAFRVDEL